MLSIAPVSRISGPRRVLPSPDARTTASTNRETTASAAAGALSGPHAPTFGAHTPFLAQDFANDNLSAANRLAANSAAVTYLLARDRLADLPVGFLISKIA
ncbi:MAG: hypothetical protein P4L98_00485 [Ancalomicrobiaceae bacterium]|nr:hypothetical protein [Ancalomicrobiaceae bacterium]